MPTFKRFFATAVSALLLFTLNAASATDNPRVLMKTSKGDIVLELNAAKAPKTVANFVRYVKDGHYDGTIFHRVIDNFMVQGGGFDQNMTQKPTRSNIANEANNGLKNAAYTIAMARTSAPHSASAQFFINLKHNSFLDYPGQDGWGYAVFGKVVKGLDVLDQIRSVQTSRKSMHGDVPVDPIIILSATLVK